MRIRRYTYIALGAWTLAAVLLLSWEFLAHTGEMQNLALGEARASWRKDILYRSWAAIHGGVYVPPTERTPPNPYLANFPDRDVVTTSGKRLTLINPAYMTRSVYEMGLERFGLLSHITSLRPVNPGNAPDPWERAALAAFEKGEAEVSSVESIGGKPHMRLMRPLVTEEGCLKCHAAQGYKVGDIRGGISVSIQMEPFFVLRRGVLWNDFLAVGLLWLVGSVAVLAGGRRAETSISRIESSENELKNQLAFREGIVECAAEGVCVCHAIPDFPYVRFTVWNPRMSEMTGYSMEEINRLGWYQSIYPDPELQARAVARMARMREGHNLHGEEWEIIRSDGETRVLAISTSVLQGGGGTVHVLALMQDITGRKRVEEALRFSEEKFRVLSDQSPLGMALIDGRGRYEYVNPAYEAMFGYTLQDLSTGADWFRVAFPDSAKRKEVVGIWKEDLADAGIGVCRPRIFEVACKGGARKTILFRPVSLRGSRQLVIYEDITERQRMESQLQQAMKMEAVGRLAGGVAHDFNNLLTVIIGNVALALAKVSPSEPVGEMLSEVNTAAERAARLTQQLLAFSRKQIIEPKVLDLNALIEDLLSMLVRLIGENIEIATIPGEGLGMVKVDPGQLEQILVNLAVNARDAMRDGGKLTIETSNAVLDDADCAAHPDARPGRYVRLSVSDTGHGMTDEVRAQIFEPFFTTKPKGSGTGLGLSMTYGAVKQVGGSIDVLSELGKGTTVRIYLPRVETEAEKGKEPAQPQELLDGTETVLLVEDEEVVRRLCVQVLERLGYNVLQAGNGAEAIAAAQGYGGRIDLLLTDVVMPGMNGSELATQLVLLHPEARVLFTSGYTDDAIVRHGVLDEGVSFIAKPYTPSALAKKIREVLDKA